MIRTKLTTQLIRGGFAESTVAKLSDDIVETLSPICLDIVGSMDVHTFQINTNDLTLVTVPAKLGNGARVIPREPILNASLVHRVTGPLRNRIVSGKAKVIELKPAPLHIAPGEVMMPRDDGCCRFWWWWLEIANFEATIAALQFWRKGPNCARDLTKTDLLTKSFKWQVWSSLISSGIHEAHMKDTSAVHIAHCIQDMLKQHLPRFKYQGVLSLGCGDCGTGVAGCASLRWRASTS